jgi:hypothetical protein
LASATSTVNGNSDVLLRSSSGEVTDWLGLANGGFVANDAKALQPVTTDYQVAGVGDFNGDGRADVLFKTADSRLEPWVGSASGAVLSPAEQEWQDAIASAGQFVDEVASHLLPPAPDTGYATQSLIGFAAIFGPQFPNVNIDDPSTNDSGFALHSIDASGFSASFGGDGFGSITQLDSSGNAYLISVNGLDLVANWIAGPPAISVPSSESIVITASRDSSGNTMSTGFFMVDPTANGFNFHNGYGGGGGGRSVPYTPAGNAWANAHLHLIGTTQADVHAWNVIHDDLARFYDWALANPDAPIQIGNGTTVSALTAIANFNQVAINIQSTGGGENGGHFQPDNYGGGTIEINPENSRFVSEYAMYGGDAVTNYGVFHEFGHQLDNVNAHSMYLSSDSDSFANTGGRSIEDYLHITLASFPGNAPPFGYK